MHRLLERQLRRHFPAGVAIPAEWQPFLDAVDRAYTGSDHDRELLERSMSISSAELLQANAEMRAVLTAFPDLFLWIDEHDRILDAKAADAQDQLLWAKTLLNKRLADFPNQEVASQLVEAQDRARASGKLVTIEYETARGDVRQVYEARFSPLESGRVIVIVRNITDTRRVELAEAASKSQSAFLANMSHELRTPLHGILSFARFGIRRCESGEPSKLLAYFDQIESSGKTLLALLNDILDLAKLEAGKAPFRFESVDLRKLIERICDEFNSSLSETGVAVQLFSPPGALEILAEPGKLGQVLRNLMSNAAKFSPAGGCIRITIAAEPAGHATLTVCDEGPGIPEQELEAIFDRFIQSSRTRTSAGGTGLGLSICREIVQAHGGRIVARNNPDRGASLVVELPLDPGSAAGAGTADTMSRTSHAS